MMRERRLNLTQYAVGQRGLLLSRTRPALSRAPRLRTSRPPYRPLPSRSSRSESDKQFITAYLGRRDLDSLNSRRPGHGVDSRSPTGRPLWTCGAGQLDCPFASAQDGATSSIRKTDGLPFGTMYVA